MARRADWQDEKSENVIGGRGVVRENGSHKRREGSDGDHEQLSKSRPISEGAEVVFDCAKRRIGTRRDFVRRGDFGVREEREVAKRVESAERNERESQT